MQSNYVDVYEPRVLGSRALLVSAPAIRALLDPSISPVLLERFLIQFCALGVQITQPVDGWIRRAGERCIALGLPEIGEKLTLHARHEAGHHHMLIADTKLLVDSWNARRAPRLDAEGLLGQAATKAMREYIELHEETITSDAPYGQVAIELEIERMSTTFGPRLVDQCRRVLGPALAQGLSFIHEHVAIDVGHTALNERMMDRLLKLRPEEGPRMASIGGAALGVYVRFFGECLDAARRFVTSS